ncbi:hypothetical protein [Streptomyces beihaiensis]|uniref:Uncharacterized protein n=1 Tax=Streptomyces beihaiensis TaxID=2984495 RepID=A0ABT3U4T2_9ACTN|nr:hypothetical protein [Streptomyces beihaiensis]MCX3064343.1 hypothetical protein [Streptomyces beihaiensis]
MDHLIGAAWPDHVVSAASSAGQGPGNLLRVVLIVGIVGAALLGWFLLRGYKSDD